LKSSGYQVASAAYDPTAAARLASLPTLVPAIRALASGADIGVTENAYDFAVAADFDDAAGYLAYHDPRHREIVATYIAPMRAGAATVHYEF
jgi:hypothetical protein